MRPSVAVVAELVAGIVPGDPQEAADVRTVLSWLDSTDDVFRRVKPAVPDRHLVSYVVPTDPSGRMLLGEHLNAGLWLAPGGHVEVLVTVGAEAAETRDDRVAARREIQEVCFTILIGDLRKRRRPGDFNEHTRYRLALRIGDAHIDAALKQCLRERW